MDLVQGLLKIWHQVTASLTDPGSVFSITSLACAFFVSLYVFASRRLARNRKLKLRVLLAAVLPRRLLRMPSVRLDLILYVMNTTTFVIMFGWAIFSVATISTYVSSGLTTMLGAMPVPPWPDYVSRILVTVALFLAYEFGYWLDHFLAHRVPFMWEFHKVHHSADVLTPLTVWRVHPIDSVIFYNIVAVSIGLAAGVSHYLLGSTAESYVFNGTNIIMVVLIHCYVQLQHSHVWIAFTGLAGRVLLSPAHHQVHHSTNPVHFNKNLGNCLSVWDWAFGTLHVPSKTPEKLTFGVEEADSAHDPHSMTSAFVRPFALAFAPLARLWPASLVSAGARTPETAAPP